MGKLRAYVGDDYTGAVPNFLPSYKNTCKEIIIDEVGCTRENINDVTCRTLVCLLKYENIPSSLSEGITVQHLLQV